MLGVAVAVATRLYKRWPSMAAYVITAPVIRCCLVDVREPCPRHAGDAVMRVLISVVRRGRTLTVVVSSCSRSEPTAEPASCSSMPAVPSASPSIDAATGVTGTGS